MIIVWIALVVAALAIAALAIAAAMGASRATRLEEASHYLTPEDHLAPMTAAQRERLERQLLIDDDGLPPAA